MAPDMAQSSAAREDVGRQHPPHRLTSAAMDASFVDGGAELPGLRWPEPCSKGGGGVAHALTLDHLCLLTCAHVNCTFLYIPLATTRRRHITKFSAVFAFIIVLCFRRVFEGA